MRHFNVQKYSFESKSQQIATLYLQRCRFFSIITEKIMKSAFQRLHRIMGTDDTNESMDFSVPTYSSLLSF